ncbi:MAG: hypothetical protein J6I68_14380 [Butyrivibrio sp.]|uniref:hypothetical protein n=1 Tax=Butyrivibrio sp. TaxID=28121 RepID=UPI001B4C1CC7|nr:hypothetical protein [Butyrivibrio sp.]MBP3784428.1 hypothetical protein [Butyrivibrio sp.]
MVSKIYLDTIPEYGKFVVLDENKKNVRCMKEKGGTIFVFAPRRSRYGRRYSEEAFVQLPYQVKIVNEAEKWHKKIVKAKNILEKSGLCPEILKVYTGLSQMTYEDYKAVCRICDSRPNEWFDKTKTAAERKAFFGDYAVKYPFLFDKDGYVDSDYYGELSDPTFKSMYFGYSNSLYKKEIARALSEKRTYDTGRVIVSYDNSFSYEPDKNHAFYREEYRGCGNGYYYLALDGNTAVFYEKD